MLLNFEITCDVPDKDWKEWIPYVKEKLLQRSHPNFLIKSAVCREELPPAFFEGMEKEAINRGELGIGL